MKLLQLFSYGSFDFSPKNFESLFNTVLGWDGIVCNDVGWRSGLNEGGDSIYNFGIGLRKIMEGMGANNQVDPYHGAPIGSSIIVVDIGRIL